MEIQGHKLLLKALVGSHAYGTNIEGSDKDYKGVFIQHPYDTFVNGYIPQINVSNDEVYYEVGRFLELCKSNNPTMLELLFIPEENIIYKDKLFGYIDVVCGKFLSKSCRWSFGGYAIDQIKKASGLDKKMNWEKDRIVRKHVWDFCTVYPLDPTLNPSDEVMKYPSSAKPLKLALAQVQIPFEKCGLVKIEHMRDTYLLFLDQVPDTGADNRGRSEDYQFNGICSGPESNDVCLSKIPSYMTPKGILYFNRDAYSIHCKEYREYEEWLEKRNTQRYVDIQGHGQQIDGKNLLHCVRLLDVAWEIGSGKGLNVKRPNAEYLVEIRKGKHDLKSIIEKCELRIKEMDKLYEESDLPEKVDEELVEKIKKTIRRLHYNSINSK